MGEEFEDRELSESVFWGVDLRRSTFRDTDFGGSTFFHVLLKDVSIDGIVERLVVNGVDVTGYVNAHDRWYPLRTMLEPQSEPEFRAARDTLGAEWARLVDRASGMASHLLLESVDGEWSFRDTLRHLVFVRDKWFSGPVLGRAEFLSVGLPNSGSRDFGWPGVHLEADPSVADLLAIRRRQDEEMSEWLSACDFSDLPPEVDVLENGTVPTVMCLHTVLEEEFEHLRYATRDLSLLTESR